MGCTTQHQLGGGDKGVTECTYGSKAAGREKSALNVTKLASLGESPCPNHPSYRLGPFTYVEICFMGTCTRIFSFLGARKRVQERVELSCNSRKSELVKLQYNPNDYK